MKNRLGFMGGHWKNNIRDAYLGIYLSRYIHIQWVDALILKKNVVLSYYYEDIFEFLCSGTRKDLVMSYYL